ncbi:MAG: hypothetical protein Q9217_001794 [Psora testacea]
MAENERLNRRVTALGSAAERVMSKARMAEDSPTRKIPISMDRTSGRLKQQRVESAESGPCNWIHQLRLDQAGDAIIYRDSSDSSYMSFAVRSHSHRGPIDGSLRAQLAQTRHTNLVSILNWFQEEDDVLLVYEIMPVSLRHMLSTKQGSCGLQILEIAAICTELLAGLEFLHDSDVTLRHTMGKPFIIPTPHSNVSQDGSADTSQMRLINILSLLLEDSSLWAPTVSNKLKELGIPGSIEECRVILNDHVAAMQQNIAIQPKDLQRTMVARNATTEDTPSPLSDHIVKDDQDFDDDYIPFEVEEPEMDDEEMETDFEDTDVECLDCEACQERNASDKGDVDSVSSCSI